MNRTYDPIESNGYLNDLYKVVADVTTRTFSTKSIEIATTIKSLTGIDPDISFDEQRLATLSFPTTTEIVEIVMGFESGQLRVEPRTLLTVRNQLYRRIRGRI